MRRGSAMRGGSLGMIAALGACAISCQRCDAGGERAPLVPRGPTVRLVSGTGEEFELTQRALRRASGPAGFEQWTFVAERDHGDGRVRALVASFTVPARRGGSTRLTPEGSSVTVRFLEDGVLTEAAMVMREGMLHEPERGVPMLRLDLAKRFATDRAGRAHAPALPAVLSVTASLPHAPSP